MSGTLGQASYSLILEQAGLMPAVGQDKCLAVNRA